MGLVSAPSDWVLSEQRSKQGELLCAELAEKALPYKVVEVQQQMMAGGRSRGRRERDQLSEGEQGHLNQTSLVEPLGILGS